MLHTSSISKWVLGGVPSFAAVLIRPHCSIGPCMHLFCQAQGMAAQIFSRSEMLSGLADQTGYCIQPDHACINACSMAFACYVLQACECMQRMAHGDFLFVGNILAPSRPIGGRTANLAHHPPDISIVHPCCPCILCASYSSRRQSLCHGLEHIGVRIGLELSTTFRITSTTCFIWAM